QLIAMSTGLGLLVPPLTSALLGSVEKSRSGIAAGVLNATRQTGSVLGVALFGSLVSRSGSFMPGLHASLMIAAVVLLAAGVAIWFSAPTPQASGGSSMIQSRRPRLAQRGNQFFRKDHAQTKR